MPQLHWYLHLSGATIDLKISTPSIHSFQALSGSQIQIAATLIFTANAAACSQVYIYIWYIMSMDISVLMSVGIHVGHNITTVLKIINKLLELFRNNCYLHFCVCQAYSYSIIYT